MKLIGEIIKAVFDENMMRKANECSALFACWKDITEKNGIPMVAAHSWIKSLDNGLVWIEVNHPGCKQIIQTKESKLLHDFCYRFPHMGISGISIMLCRPSTNSESAKNEPTTEEDPPPDNPFDIPDTRDSLAYNSEYDAIKNKTLRKLLMRLEKNITEEKT
ncbi:MAG: hypothetical protein FWB78_01105 [Treponema sp.]|nr:hypothetical protein [Treponema sp.]